MTPDAATNELVHLLGVLFEQGIRSWDAGRIGEAMATFNTVNEYLKRLPDKLIALGSSPSDVLAPAGALGSQDRVTLGREVRALRKRLGLSQKALGDAVGLRHTSISQIELNQGAIADATAERVRDRLREEIRAR